MVFEYILKNNGIDRQQIWKSTRALTLAPQRRLSQVMLLLLSQWNSSLPLPPLRKKGLAMWLPLLA